MKHIFTNLHLGQNGDKCAKNHAICEGTHVLAKVYGDGYPTGEGWGERSEAFARLCAAAPELLEALEAVLQECVLYQRYWGDGSNAKGARDAEQKARAAIAKATGRIEEN